MSEECLDEITERSSSTVTVSFFDEDGNAVTPDAATYRIDVPVSRTSILPATTFPSLSTAVDLEITSDQNRVVKERQPSEVHEVTIEFDYTAISGPKHGTARYRYRIINLYGVTTVPSASVSPSSSTSPSV
jgi:hypothetical protein